MNDGDSACWRRSSTELSVKLAAARRPTARDSVRAPCPLVQAAELDLVQGAAAALYAGHRR